MLDARLSGDTEHRTGTQPQPTRQLAVLARLTAPAHVLVPAITTAAVGAGGITTPTLWRDEIITWAASTRLMSELAHTLNDVDGYLLRITLFMYI